MYYIYIIIYIIACIMFKIMCTYEPPSKSIVDAWYENIGYRFLVGGPIALQCFIQINTE